jgi:hypothetical protein
MKKLVIPLPYDRKQLALTFYDIGPCQSLKGVDVLGVVPGNQRRREGSGSDTHYCIIRHTGNKVVRCVRGKIYHEDVSFSFNLEWSQVSI